MHAGGTPAARRAITRAGAVLSGVLAASAAWPASVLTLGPDSVQALVVGQLFSRAGRWYLIDQGAVCYTYLESPRTRLQTGRLVLSAHLSSRIGQRLGGNCIGGDFASNVTLSARLRGGEHTLVLDDIRIDRVDDEATRSALELALQMAPQAMTRTASIDVQEFIRRQLTASKGPPVRLEHLHLSNVTTRSDAVVMEFDLSLSAP